MSKYKISVVISGAVTIEAENEDEAIEQCYDDLFTVENIMDRNPDINITDIKYIKEGKA